MRNDADVPVSSEDEVCHIIGKAAVDLSLSGQSVNNATLGVKLSSMADQDNDDERILLYWIATKAINQPHRLMRNR